MNIANPIYDAVFKYLMEDKESARILISTIIEKEIISLELSPKEKVYRIEAGDEKPPMAVYRLDFAARIKTETGFQTILIEIQKAKYAADIMRFRRYLGSQYRDKNNSYPVEYKWAGEIRKKRKAIPILTIYFLGYELEHTDVPIIEVARKYYDKRTGRQINIKEEFIETLTHDSYVIQIPYLQDEVQTETERLLSVFNQKTATDSGHILTINEFDYPEKYRRIIRRLMRAASEEEIRDNMDLEDDYLEELYDLERTVHGMNKVVEESKKALKEKDKALGEKDKALGESKKTLKEKDKALGEKDKALGESKKTLKEKEEALGEKNKIIEEQDEKLGDKDKELGDKDKLIEEQKRIIEALQEK